MNEKDLLDSWVKDKNTNKMEMTISQLLNGKVTLLQKSKFNKWENIKKGYQASTRYTIEAFARFCVKEYNKELTKTIEEREKKIIEKMNKERLIKHNLFNNSEVAFLIAKSNEKQAKEIFDLLEGNKCCEKWGLTFLKERYLKVEK